MALPHTPGDRVLVASPLGMFIATFISDDEGWAKLQFADDSIGTMRPSQVHVLDILALDMALEEYSRSIAVGEHYSVQRMGVIVDDIAIALGITNDPRIEKLRQYAEEAYAI